MKRNQWLQIHRLKKEFPIGSNAEVIKPIPGVDNMYGYCGKVVRHEVSEYGPLVFLTFDNGRTIGYAPSSIASSGVPNDRS